MVHWWRFDDSDPPGPRKRGFACEKPLQARKIVGPETAMMPPRYCKQCLHYKTQRGTLGYDYAIHHNYAIQNKFFLERNNCNYV